MRLDRMSSSGSSISTYITANLLTSLENFLKIINGNITKAFDNLFMTKVYYLMGDIADINKIARRT